MSAAAGSSIWYSRRSDDTLKGGGEAMSAVIETPRTMIESLAEMRFPARTDALLQSLMHRNTNGQLTADEREELEALAELSETISLVRAQALRLLGRSPA
jgi:hypothetical protein